MLQPLLFGAKNKILILDNPKSGSNKTPNAKLALEQALAALPESVRADVEVVVPPTIGDIEKVIGERQGDLRRVVAKGGDGMVKLVMAAARKFPGLETAILPFGTGNRLAMHLKIPPRAENIRASLNIALNGQPSDLDIGEVTLGDGKKDIFALTAGIGVDADVMDNVSPKAKQTFGVLAYLDQFLREIPKMRNLAFEMDIDGKQVQIPAVGVIVENMQNGVGPFRLNPSVSHQDGLFDVVIMALKSKNNWAKLLEGLSQVALCQQRPIEDKRGGLLHVQAKKLKLVTPKDENVKVELDGDVVGKTPVEIEVLPKAVKLIVP